jgi:hypothetical protein
MSFVDPLDFDPDSEPQPGPTFRQWLGLLLLVSLLGLALGPIAEWCQARRRVGEPPAHQLP